MKCLRIYATPDGESHFDEVELPTTKRQVHPDAVPFDVTGSYPASRVRITHIPAGMREVVWHTVPEPVLTIRLDGSVEYGTSDGEVRHVPAGIFVLVEDTRQGPSVTPFLRGADGHLGVTAQRPHFTSRIVLSARCRHRSQRARSSTRFFADTVREGAGQRRSSRREQAILSDLNAR